MQCEFDKEKECGIRCQYYHTCTRSPYRKEERKAYGKKRKQVKRGTGR